MAADLHIHVFTDEFTEEHYKAFSSNTLGSKFFNLNNDSKYEDKNRCDLFELCSWTPQVWVGEVSWLKAALTGDGDEYIPGPVVAVSEIIDESFPVINEELISEIYDAMKIDNDTEYDVSSADDVICFLKDNLGKKAFTISW